MAGIESLGSWKQSRTSWQYYPQWMAAGEYYDVLALPMVLDPASIPRIPPSLRLFRLRLSLRLARTCVVGPIINLVVPKEHKIYSTSTNILTFTSEWFPNIRKLKRETRAINAILAMVRWSPGGGEINPRSWHTKWNAEKHKKNDNNGFKNHPTSELSKSRHIKSMLRLSSCDMMKWDLRVMRMHGTSWNTSEATEGIQAVLLWEVWRHLHQLNLFQELLASFNGSSQFLLQVNIILSRDHKRENDVSYRPKSKSHKNDFKICSSHLATGADFRTGPLCSNIIEVRQGQGYQGNSHNSRNM